MDLEICSLQNGFTVKGTNKLDKYVAKIVASPEEVGQLVVTLLKEK
jgi:hypothetical protein